MPTAVNCRSTSPRAGDGIVTWSTSIRRTPTWNAAAARAIIGSFLERPSDFPVMAERIDHTAEPPAVLVVHGNDLRRAGSHSPHEHRIGVGDRKHHPHRAAAERFRAEVLMCRRLVSDPELRAVYGQARDDGAIRRIDAKRFDRPERGFVEIDGLRATPNGEHRRNRLG